MRDLSLGSFSTRLLDRNKFFVSSFSNDDDTKIPDGPGDGPGDGPDKGPSDGPDNGPSNEPSDGQGDGQGNSQGDGSDWVSQLLERINIDFCCLLGKANAPVLACWLPIDCLCVF